MLSPRSAGGAQVAGFVRIQEGAGDALIFLQIQLRG